MINFVDVETVRNDEVLWVTVQSTWSDLISFVFGKGEAPIDFNDINNKDRYAAFAIEGAMIPDLHRLAKEGVRPEWLGVPAGPWQAVPGAEKEFGWMDIVDNGNEFAIVIGRYPESKTKGEGVAFDYPLPKEDFLSLTNEMMELHEYVTQHDKDFSPKTHNS